MDYNGPSSKPHDVGAAVAVVVAENGRVLLLKRKGSTGEGTWSIPGGALEFGEDPVEAGKRELAEETGLNANELEFICYSNDVHAETPLHYITLRFFTNDFSGQPYVAEPHKASAIDWFPIEDLPSPIFEFSREILNRPEIINKIKATK